jgi:hypothetical protein
VVDFTPGDDQDHLLIGGVFVYSDFAESGHDP